MKSIIKLFSLLTMMLFFTPAYSAEEFIPLKDAKPILGTWIINAEAAALHKEKKQLNNIWKFGKNGKMSAVSRDRRLGGKQEIQIKYSIENGMIKKQFMPGREKYENCKVIKLEGKNMVLHCKFNYFFMTKK